MTIDEVEKHFGRISYATEALGLTCSSVTYWRTVGYIPLKQQYRLSLITNGELKPDLDDPFEMKKLKTQEQGKQ